MPPGHPPKRAQIDPSRFQEVTVSLLNLDLVLGSILGSILAPGMPPFGLLLAPFGRPKTIKK